MRRTRLKPGRSFSIYRGQILEGKSFNVLAIMYSEDPGTCITAEENSVI